MSISISNKLRINKWKRFANYAKSQQKFLVIVISFSGSAERLLLIHEETIGDHEPINWLKNRDVDLEYSSQIPNENSKLLKMIIKLLILSVKTHLKKRKGHH